MKKEGYTILARRPIYEILQTESTPHPGVKQYQIEIEREGGRREKERVLQFYRVLWLALRAHYGPGMESNSRG